MQEKVMKNVARYEKTHDVVFTKELAALKLFEESGEFAQALVVHNKQSRPSKFKPFEESKHDVALELADILGIIILNAHVHDIDLEAALHEKWMSKVE